MGSTIIIVNIDHGNHPLYVVPIILGKNTMDNATFWWIGEKMGWISEINE
jgi:hypothetical protein